MSAEARFSALFERHYRDVERYLRRRAPEPMVADLAAEVFLVAWRRWKIVPQERPLPWLYTTARNVLANEVRGQIRGRRLAERVAARAESPVGEDHAEQVSSRLAVAAAFDRLAEADREVLRLVAWERLDRSDAAKVLGCGTAAFAMRLARARRRLRAALTEPAEPAQSRVSARSRTGARP